MHQAPHEAVIGLEVHAQLLTESKIYCGCPTSFGAEPNTQVCPVCLGLPGALPVLNREAVTMAIMVGLATGCRIAGRSVFARKNYFYPDSPKNYQISMYDRPLCEDGVLEFEVEDGIRRVGIERIHLENDAGKLVHGGLGSSYIDFNRCGMPLIEIVTKPDIRSPAGAGGFLLRLRQLLRYLGVCDGNMEEGSLRCDVNVSVRPAGTEGLGTKTEIKNLNSFKAVEAGITAEIERQRVTLDAGGGIEQVTHLWDAVGKRLVPMRSKEYAHDYRYFPEPDLPPLDVDEGWIELAERRIPELPLARERRFGEEYGLSTYESGVLCAERGTADYFEAVVKLTGDPKATSNWVMREVLEELGRGGAPIERFAVPPERLAALIGLVGGGVISGTAGREVFKEMVRTGEEAADIVARRGLQQISDAEALETIIDAVLADHPGEVDRYRAGKVKLLGFFVGQVMERSGGKANPKRASEIIRKKLTE